MLKKHLRTAQPLRGPFPSLPRLRFILFHFLFHKNQEIVNNWAENSEKRGAWDIELSAGHSLCLTFFS